MGAAFLLEGAAILLLSRFGHNAAAFVMLTALVFFAYGAPPQHGNAEFLDDVESI